MTPKRFLQMVIFLLAGMRLASAQVCSTGSAQMFQDDKSFSGPCSSTFLGYFINVTETQGYNLSCVTTKGNRLPGNFYFTNSVTQTGTGQRFCGSLTSSAIFCDPVFTMVVTQATSVTDFHRFTFSETSRTTGGSSCSSGASQQIFRQCAGQPCDGTSTSPCGASVVPLGQQGEVAVTSCSPIIIDVEGEGFRLTTAANGVMFDIAGNGNPVKIAGLLPVSIMLFWHSTATTMV
jgi:hypothetical protein